MANGKQPSAAATGDVDGDTGDLFAEINITPFTDVILALLIIFMVYAATAVSTANRRVERVEQAQRSGLKVNLPEGQAKEIDIASKSLVVSILSDGSLVVNSQAVADEDIKGVFQNAFAKDKETQVVLHADGDVVHERVVVIMERAKSVGLTRLAIATKGAK